MLLGAILTAAIAPAFAQTTSGMPMDRSMSDMHESETAQATGVVKAIDAGNATITIQHHAIASIHWPAMTMTFKADPPGLLKNVKVGERVAFTLHPDGTHSTVTAINPVK
jgi:Cu(I)/Ag(I) efflux system protein CusF